jgi:hypothetical protein
VQLAAEQQQQKQQQNVKRTQLGQVTEQQGMMRQVQQLLHCLASEGVAAAAAVVRRRV